jgi:5-methylthioribose kinase
MKDGFEEWFYDLEGFHIRSERFWTDYETQNRDAMIEWLKTAIKWVTKINRNFMEEQIETKTTNQGQKNTNSKITRKCNNSIQDISRNLSNYFGIYGWKRFQEMLICL